MQEVLGESDSSDGSARAEAPFAHYKQVFSWTVSSRKKEEIEAEGKVRENEMGSAVPSVS